MLRAVRHLMNVTLGLDVLRVNPSHWVHKVLRAVHHLVNVPPGLDVLRVNPSHWVHKVLRVVQCIQFVAAATLHSPYMAGLPVRYSAVSRGSTWILAQLP